MYNVAFSSLHVLVVDASPDNLKLLRGMLTFLGIEDIVVAENSGAAVEALKAGKYDAVFLDERVGPSNAVAFTLELRRDPDAKNRRAPIILMVEKPRVRQVELARDAGVNGLLVRPFSVGDVKSRLVSVLTAPKPFIAEDKFAGPDRRRKDRRDEPPADPLPPGKERRKRGPRRRKSDQAEGSGSNP